MCIRKRHLCLRERHLCLRKSPGLVLINMFQSRTLALNTLVNITCTQVYTLSKGWRVVEEGLGRWGSLV